MDKLKPYPKYKPVNLPWLKEIPTHWKIKKIKYLFSERSQKGFPNEPLLAATQSMGVVPKDVYGERTVEASKGLETLKLVEIGDFVASLRSFQGGLEYAYYRGIISSAYTIITSNGELQNHYFRHFAKSFAFIQLLKLCVTGIREGQNINYEVLKNNILPIPPIEEQEKIVAYLDEKVSKIDKYIATESEKIKLLRELKNAEISQAVTRGLNPNAKFKPVNLPWLKEIPAHWELKRTKTLFYNKKELNIGLRCNNLLSLTMKGVVHNDMDNPMGLSPESYESYQIFYPNDLAFKLIDLQNVKTSRVGLVLEKGIMSSAYIRFSKRDKDLYEKYYYYYYIDQYNKCIFNALGDGVRSTLSADTLLSLYIPIPSREEQEKIVAYLDEKVSKIDEAISAIQRKIDLMKEYKNSLISSVVTGKVQVA